MSELKKEAWKITSQLYAAGYALDAIGELLGADGCEHHLNAHLTNGLHHAVQALGQLVLQCGGVLAELSDPDDAEVPA